MNCLSSKNKKKIGIVLMVALMVSAYDTTKGFYIKLKTTERHNETLTVELDKKLKQVNELEVEKKALNTEIDTLLKDKEDANKKLENANKKLDDTSKKLENANEKIKEFTTTTQQKNKQIRNIKHGVPIQMTLTFYGEGADENGGYAGITAWGEKLVGGMVASNVYPRGTKFSLNGKTYTVSDKGGSNFNSYNRLDVFVPRWKNESNSEYKKRINTYGKRTVTMYKM